MSAVLDEALDLARRGYRVFPVGRNKHPDSNAVPNGCLDATSDDETITRWFTGVPGRQVAVATGNGLLVVDLDVTKGNDGIARMAELEAKYNCPLPDGPAVRTPSGGIHRWFSVDPSLDIRCSASVIAPGIDIRCNGGYVVVPPASGYRWEVDLEGYETLPPAPQFLIDLCTSRPEAEPTERTGDPVQAFIDASKEPGKWHCNVRDLVAHLWGIGTKESLILALAAELTTAGFTVEQTVKDLRVMLKGAKDKWPRADVNIDGLVEKAEKAREHIDPETGEVHGEEEGDDLAELCAEEFPPVVEHIKGLIADGLTILAAKPKVGKSWFLLDMGLSIAGGGCAAGTLQATMGQSLLLMLEDSRRRLKDRALIMTADGSVPPGCRVFTKWPRGAEGAAKLDQWLADHPAVKFVGIDVLARIRGDQKDAKGSIYQADYDAVAMLQDIAQRRGVAIVLVHHTRKADSDDPIDLISGTLGIAGGADHLVVITGNKEIGYKLTSRGRDLPDASWDMTFDFGRWTVLGNSKPKKKVLDKEERAERDNRILELHRQDKSQREIADEVGCSVSTVNGTISASYLLDA